MRKLIVSLAVLPSFLMVGCASYVYDTNRAAVIPTPSISSTNSLASIEVGEEISGSGCAKEFLWIFKSGDNKFLDVNGNYGDGAIDRAKASATYTALAAKKGLSTDILIHPIWEIQVDETLISKNVCAKVKGYRGVIKSFKQTDKITEPTQANTAEGPAKWYQVWKK